MLQIPHAALVELISAVYPYVQLFTAVSLIFAIAWWLHDSRSELFTKLDKITDNHLSHIEAGITKLSDQMPKYFQELHDHQTREEVILSDIRDNDRKQS
jgi:cell shape-determining protein MreC